MCNFRVGQKVCAATPIAKKQFGTGVLTVANVIVCGCGHVSISILEFPTNSATCFSCYKCRHRHPPSGYAGMCAEDFRPVIDDYTEEEIEAVNIDELVEPEYEPV